MQQRRRKHHTIVSLVLVLLLFIHHQSSSSAFVVIPKLFRQSFPFVTTHYASSKPTTDAEKDSSSTTTTTGSSSIQSPHFGGTLIPIQTEDESFLSHMSVPTYAAIPTTTTTTDSTPQTHHHHHSNPQKLGLEGIIDDAFLLQNVFSPTQCEEMIQTCETTLRFGDYQSGKNHHGAMQIVVSEDVASSVFRRIAPYANIPSSNSNNNTTDHYHLIGLNRRWRLYRYSPSSNETFAAHIDAGFPGSGLSEDGSSLIWDAYASSSKDEETVVSRYTVLFYLNDDFEGGHTRFYAPVSRSKHPQIIASIAPRRGSALVFPQAVGEEEVQRARTDWSMHEGAPVLSGRSKYVIRSDLLFSSSSQPTMSDDPLFRYDHLVRDALIPSSPLFNPLFLSHTSSLYHPHMGVESMGAFLHSFIRFVKPRTVVEIGAGYTTPYILQALRDNDDELQAIQSLQHQHQCRLMDYPWTVESYVDRALKRKAKLTCIDDCAHQKQTASAAARVAEHLNLQEYLEFIRGDAFDVRLPSHSVDLLWCDFGVGDRMQEFLANAWEWIAPGGYLICHSTLTNKSTRAWLEAIRRTTSSDETDTGLPPGEYVELSLLEPHKRFQNSITILQKRTEGFEEPIYSEFA